VLSNIAPKYTHDMIENYFNGNIHEATNMQLNCIDIVNSLFCEVNPIPVKEALNMLGYNYGVPRLPLVKISDAGRKILESSLKNFEFY